jgi:hypothetical protein
MLQALRFFSRSWCLLTAFLIFFTFIYFCCFTIEFHPNQDAVKSGRVEKTRENGRSDLQLIVVGRCYLQVFSAVS